MKLGHSHTHNIIIGKRSQGLFMHAMHKNQVKYFKKKLNIRQWIKWDKTGKRKYDLKQTTKLLKESFLTFFELISKINPP